jgi:thiol-disulfide isomerase/thioredoxin
VHSQQVPSWKITNLQKYISDSDSVLVVNFWATFCKPCIEELPYIQSISNKKKEGGVALLLVSLDLPEAFPSAIDSFVKVQNYSAPVVWLNETNADYFCPKIDKSWSGVIPSTLIVNGRTGYKKFIEEHMSAERFEKELNKALAEGWKSNPGSE